MKYFSTICLVTLIASALSCAAQPNDAAPATPAPASTQPAAGKLAHIQVDVKNRQIRVECEAIRVPNPLEFFCVTTTGPDHETILRTEAKPSDIHFAMLMLGLKAGEPVHYSEAAKRWFAPHGPPIRIDVEYQKGDETVHMAANRWMRDQHTKKEMPATTWMFVGSRVMEDGTYAADTTGYIVSVVNFDLTVIDVPDLASNANETLEWEYNPDTVPEAGTKVTMILQVVGDKDAANPAGQETKPEAATKPTGETPGAAAKIDVPLVKVSADGKIWLDEREVPLEHLTERLEKLRDGRDITVRLAAAPDVTFTKIHDVFIAIEAADVGVTVVGPVAVGKNNDATDQASTTSPTVDAAHIAALEERWRNAVAPHRDAIKEAAQAHYEVISAMRSEQTRLVEEVDRLQRAIEELEQQYQEMTTPQPETEKPKTP